MILVYIKIGDPMILGHFIIPQECIKNFPFGLIDIVYLAVIATDNLHSLVL